MLWTADDSGGPESSQGLDVLSSLADLAHRFDWRRPDVDDSDALDIEVGSTPFEPHPLFVDFVGAAIQRRASQA